jgi:hypothetical protein
VRIQQAVKLFLTLLLCTTYIFSFSHFGVLAYDSIVIKENGAASVQNHTLLEQQTVPLEDDQDEIIRFEGKSIKIDGKSQFSFLRFIKEEGLSNLSPRSLNRIATAIYGIILPTNFSINERHISGELPDYASPGFEAKINSKQDFDLLYTNPNEDSFYITFEKKNKSLSVSLKGAPFQEKYKISTSEKEYLKPVTIIQHSSQIKVNEMILKEEGQKGFSLKVYREFYDDGGELLHKELISEDIYPPMNRIEEWGTDSGGTSKGNSPRDNEGQSSQDETQPVAPAEESDLWGIPNEIPKQ